MTPLFLTPTIKKCVLFFFLAFCFQLIYSENENSDVQITVPDFKGTAKELLNLIGTSENLVFAYSSEISLDYQVTFSKQQLKLESFLKIILKDKPISYKIKGNKVQLFPVKQPSTDAFNLTQVVRGCIVDADSKLPLPGATVIIQGTSPLIATSTDANGIFKFEKIPVGHLALQISYMGYDKLNVNDLVVNSGKETVLDLSLQEAVSKIEEVVVTGARNKGDALNEMSLLSSRSISTEETKRYTGGMDDPARVVSSFAGVAATQDGSSDIIVRGNSPKYMQWRLDGIEITSPYHMDDQNASFGALTALNNSLLATSDFYTSAFAPEYGNVLSSVMDVKLRTGNNEKFEATCGVGIMGTDITLEGPIKQGYGGSYLINYRYSTISLVKKMGILPGIDGIVNYQDATFKVVLPTQNIGTFSIIGLGGLSGFSMKNITPNGITTPGRITNADFIRNYDKSAKLSNIGISHTLTINNNSYLKSSVSYSANGMDDDLKESAIIRTYNDQQVFISDSTTEQKQIFESKIINASYRGAITYNTKIDAKNRIQIGTKYTQWQFKYNQDIFDDSANQMINVTDFNKGTGTINNFISWKYSINDHFSLVSGLHNMNVLLNKKSTLEPRIALNWQVNEKNAFHAGFGKYSTMESIHNYFTKVTQTDGSVTEPNKNLGLLKADHYVLGYENRLSENLVAKIEVYYQHLYNLPVDRNDTSYYATINEGRDYQYVALVNKGTGKNYGMELTLEHFFDKNYYFLVNASIFDSKYKSLEGVWRNTQYNSNALVNILVGKEFKNLGRKQNKTLALNTRAFISGGQRYIPLLRDENGNVAVDKDNNHYFDYSKAFDKKLGILYSINFSVSYKINKPQSTKEIFIDLMNIAHSNGKLGEYYDESKPNKIGYIKQMIFFPNIMYRIYF